MGLLRPDGPGAPSLDAAKWGTWGLGLPRPRPDKLGVPPPRRPSRPAGPRAAPKLPTRRRPVPAVPAPRTEQNLRRPDKSARGPGTPRELPAPPGAPPRPAPAATPHPAGPAQALGAQLGLRPGKLRSGPHAVCGHSLGSESPKPPPRTASPRRRLAPTEVGGGSGRACATAPGSGGRSDLRPGLAVGVGVRAPEAVSPRPPQVHPPVSPTSLPTVAPSAHSPASRARDPLSSLRRADNSWMEPWPVTPVAPPEQGRDG